MVVTLDLILLVIALVCFLLAALNIGGTPPNSRVNLIAVGLALWVLTLITPT